MEHGLTPLMVYFCSPAAKTMECVEENQTSVKKLADLLRFAQSFDEIKVIYVTVRSTIEFL